MITGCTATVLRSAIPANAFTIPPLKTRSIAAGHYHSVAIREDGNLIGWGWGGNGETSLVSGGLVSVTAGERLTVAIKNDGTVTSSGSTADDRRILPTFIYEPNNPPVIQVSSRFRHSLAVNVTGAYPFSWGNNADNQNALSATNVVQVAAGAFHSYVLRADGTLVGAGFNGDGQLNHPTSFNSPIVQITCGFRHNLARLADGTVVAWGANWDGECDVPVGLNNVVDISAGSGSSYAVKSDGTIVAWGWGGDGQLDVPAGLTDVVQIAAGGWHAIALKSDGTVVGWGWNADGQTNPPPGLKVKLPQ